MLLSAVSCGKREKDRIYKDSPWYSNVTFDVGDHLKSSGNNIDFLNTFFAGFDGERFYYVLYGDYAVPEDADYSKIDYDDYNFNYLDVISSDGTLEKSIDLLEDVKLPEELTDGHKPYYLQYLPADKEVSNGKINLKVSFDINYEPKQFDIVFDAENGKIESYKPSSEELDKKGIPNTHTGFEYSFEGYSVREHYTSSLNTMVYLEIKKPDGEILVANVNKSLPDARSHEVRQIIYAGNGKALVEFESALMTDGGYGLLDLNTGNLAMYAEDTSWFRSYFQEFQPGYVDGSGYIFSFGNSLKLVDFAEKEIRDIFSFDCCNLNKCDLDGLSVLAMTDEKIVLAGSTYHKAGLDISTSGSSVYVLTKERMNPNAGKTILTAATTSDFDYAFCEAVRRFNDTNPDYFIQLDTWYSYKEKYYNGEFPESDINALQMSSKYEKMLIADVMNGEGPDIIVNPGRSRELYNGEYLLDLSSDIDTSVLFGNAVELAKCDGKLYQVPLSVSVSGILTDRANVKDGQTGFTFDQYKEFVKGPCNGKNPLGNNRTDAFTDCLGPVFEDHVNGKTVDINAEDIKLLADYVKDNIFEPAKDPDNDTKYAVPDNVINGGICELSLSFGFFIDDYYMQDINSLTMAGFPSHDGRGPVLSFSSSVAISAKTKAKDALVEFVRLLLSDEIQLLSAEDCFMTPVRISAYEAFAEEKISMTNEKIRSLNKQALAMGYATEADAFKEIDMSVIENYKKMIGSCSVSPSMDPEITIIVYEEIPAYFAGQKSFGEVAKLINNRATTYLNERG